MAEHILNRLAQAVNSLKESSNEAYNLPGKCDPAMNEHKTEGREVSLKQLYPSIREQFSSSLSGSFTSASTSRVARNAFNYSSGNYGKGKTRGNKRASSVSKPVLKYVILIPSPSVDEVSSGQFRDTLYSKRYAASAVEFTDDMPEEEIRSK